MLDTLVARCEQRYLKKIKKMVDLCTRNTRENDALIIIEGREGTGKTNTSEVTAGVFKHFANREVFMFFDLQKLIIKAQNTTGLIFIWDEPALDSLTTDQLNSLNKDLMKLLMTCRVNRHFFIINITDFVKFSKYITVERPVGFVHLYKLRTGHGCYIRWKRLEALHLGWSEYHKRLYNKYKSFYVDFPLLSSQEWLELDMNINGVPHASLEEYTTQKRLAISGIGQKDNTRNKLKNELKRLKQLIGTAPLQFSTKDDKAKHYKVSARMLYYWEKEQTQYENEGLEGDGAVFEPPEGTNIVKLGEKETRSQDL